MRQRDFTPASKLEQILLSILAGCETLSEVNPHLRQERVLAAALGIQRLADQSSLSRTLDALTLKNIDELRTCLGQIWQPLSRVRTRDWRRYLWLDFDLSGLPCGPQAEASQKGYFAGKKKRTWQAVGPRECDSGRRNHLVSRLSWQLPYRSLLATGGRSHRNCFRVISSATQAYRLAPGWRGRLG